MNNEELIAICRERNEVDFLFEITKSIAESDSIGEMWSHCKDYTREYFNNMEKHQYDGSVEPSRDDYLEYGGLPVYKLYLQHLNIIPKDQKD